LFFTSYTLNVSNIWVETEILPKNLKQENDATFHIYDFSIVDWFVKKFVSNIVKSSGILFGLQEKSLKAFY
jgi:hypothetical protein